MNELENTVINIKFPHNASWVILSPIEQRIKEKIEKVGVPLKDWEDIRINYGIKTGCNEAFIIDKAKKDELIRQSPNSVEIIRPILRGKDIKKYGYNFADKYLIATFPSKKYNIEDYPAVRDYLLNFGKSDTEYLTQYGNDCWGKNRLAQSGNKGSRKKTHNKWFELQDSIAYWDDFNKQKIIWGNLNLRASYSIAPEGILINAPATMIVPASKYLLCILNSKLADYYIRKLGVTRNGGYFEYKPMFIEQLPVPYPINNSLFLAFDDNILYKYTDEIDNIVYTLYNLNKEERDYIETTSL